MSYEPTLLPKLSSHQVRILAKEQVQNSHTFWAMPILIFSPVQIIITHPLWWRLRKILWPSQNIWTLLQTVLPGRAVPENLLKQSDVVDIKSLSQKQSVKSRLFTSAEIKYQRFLIIVLKLASHENLNEFINYFYFLCRVYHVCSKSNMPT